MGRMMIKLAEAIGRMVLALRDLNRLAGLTARVNQLTTVISDINSGSYQRSMISKGKYSIQLFTNLAVYYELLQC